MNDLLFAVETLVRQGLTREQAMATVIADPSSAERLGAQGREAARREAEEREAAAFAASPEGRREAALAAAQRRREREQLVSAARDLLAEQGIDASGLDERRVLTLAGIEKRTRAEFSSLSEWDREVETLASSWSRLSDDERWSEAKRLDVSPAEVTKYVETFLGQPVASNSNGGDA